MSMKQRDIICFVTTSNTLKYCYKVVFLFHCFLVMQVLLAQWSRLCTVLFPGTGECLIVGGGRNFSKLAPGWYLIFGWPGVWERSPDGGLLGLSDISPDSPKYSDNLKIHVFFRAKTTHPWEKNSPVFENRDYLNLVYEDLMKNQYIKTASASSRVIYL